MRWIFPIFLLLTFGVRAETADPAAIRAVIAQQIEAFRHDDGPAAFSFASPDIQAMFGTPGNFMAMVERGYQPVYRPGAVAFGALQTEEGGIVQRVELIGPDGAAYTALYSVEREPDGSWRISGCRIIEGHSAGA